MGDWFEEEDGQFGMAEVKAKRKDQAGEENQENEDLYQQSDWEAIIEAVLFTMGDSVDIHQLAHSIGQGEDIAKQVVKKLQCRYEQSNCGMQILTLDDSYQMVTRAKFYENLIRVACAPKKQVLTDVMMETLSIIAYKQPVTKTEISRIRGVSSDHAINRLVEYGLVYEAGRMDAPGRPVLFATTEEFLRRFGVGSTADLPTMNPQQEKEIVQEVEKEIKMHLDVSLEDIDADSVDFKDTGTDMQE